MNRRHLLLTAACLALWAPKAFATGGPVPPVARREPKRTVQLGRTRIDDYAWMRDPNYQEVFKDPAKLRNDIRAHIEAENAYSSEVLASTSGLQAQLTAEMRARIQPDDETPPMADGPWVYVSRFLPGADHPVYLRRPRGGGAEEVLLDAGALAKGKAFFHIEHATHSPDHRLFAYTVDEKGSEFYRLVIIDLATGKALDGPVDAGGEFVFSPDSKWLFWLRLDPRGRTAAVMRRPVRGTSADDKVVHEEADEALDVSVRVSSDRQFILLASQNRQKDETWVISASNCTAPARVMQPRIDGLLYRVDRWDGRFVILTNADGAIDYKIVSVEGLDLSKARWRDLVPHRPGRFIVEMTPTRDHLARLERFDALDRIVIRSRASGEEKVLGFEEEAFALSLEPGYEYDADVLRYTYQSPVTPPQWWDQDMAGGGRTLVKRAGVPGYDPSLYVAKRLTAKASDGALIPITAVMKRGTPTNGTAPLLLFGYGAYGLAIEPVFSSPNVCLLDRGWICATAHIRGGSERGRQWFLDGRVFNKKNTFTDYIACAEHLCAIGYGKPKRILAYGRSAGGMLMGAVLNLRPDLWAGVLAGVPFVDVINTMSDTTLPLTPPEWAEWGNPLTDPKAYDYMAGYSPYDNVRPHAFPPVLATCGLTDPRVTYWEPAKWVARLRAANRGPNPILLHTNMGAGHKGAAGRYDALKDAALNHAFALWAMARSGRLATTSPVRTTR
jgi:oligopeptidase B